MYSISHFDHHLTDRIRIAGQRTLPMWIFFATYGMWVLGFIALTMAIFGVVSWTYAIFPVVSTHLLALILQQTIRRERPPLAMSKITMWWRTPSFPSAHAAGSMAFSIVIGSGILQFGSAGIIFAILVISLAFFIGFSRIVVGVHYATDVFCGFVFGAVVSGIFLSVL